MRSVFALGMVLLLAAVASSQTLIVDAAGAGDGKYWIEVQVTDGTVTAHVVSSDNVVVLTDEGTGPVDPGDTDGIARVALKSKALVTDDPNKDASATKLSVVYDALAKEIGTRFTHEGGDAPWQKLADATKQVREVVLGNAASAWSPWSAAIGTALSKMEEAQQLETESQMAEAYRDIADGLTADLQQQGLDPMWIDLIMQIIKLILELLSNT